MSSGDKSILIAVNERAEPIDIETLQRFEAQRTAEMVRWGFPQKIAGSFYSNPGMVTAYDPVADAAPPTDEVAHQCLSGLLVRPGTTFCAVDPGAAAFYQPLRAGLSVANDSPWIFGFSLGLNDAAQLTFLANAGPGIRWDIIECQVAADAVLTVESRQVFDPLLQTFSPQNVNKVQSSAFNYRIRRGVQGAGIPAIDADWMALAAVHVRTDSTGFDNSDLFDIRPLLAERCPFGTRHPLAAPSGGETYKSVLYEAEMRTTRGVGVNGMLLEGYFRGHFGGYWSGGEIRNNLPAVDLGDFGSTGVVGSSLFGFNYEDPDRRSAAFALTANGVIALGCFFPRGYPRWVRYSQSPLASSATTRLRSAGRFPEGCRGILMALNGADGGGLIKRNGVIAPATLPTSFGETQACWGHVVQYAIVDNAGTGVRPAEGDAQSNLYTWQGFTVVQGGGLDPIINQSVVATGPAVTADLSGATAFALRADYIPGLTRIPISASAVACSLLLGVTVAAAGQYSMVVPGVAYETSVNMFARAVPGLDSGEFTNDAGAPTNAVQLWNFLFPLKPNGSYGNTGAADEMRLAMNFIGAGLSAPGGSTLIHGYQL